MHLAIEYMMRHGLLRDFFEAPCSLFLARGLHKKVVTITEEFKPSPFYCVKHWSLHACNRNQATPSFAEFRVPKQELFGHQAVIVAGHRLMPYEVAPIPFHENEYNRPMHEEMYSFFYDNYLNSYRHREKKKDWLWKEFVRVYMPELSEQFGYISPHLSEAELAVYQRNSLGSIKKYQSVWRCWVKWCKYMLPEKTHPGELVFLTEYEAKERSHGP